ncbi:unnamed protein product [Schistosoma margrebowiei]|uniref:Uncharacterized protein n=1 Tax=Schistosoma margrebowiei TaxID=48269 RepID=A0A183LVJ4_9TREM|nr:unnamed protein product [Schistosoma margrebowiei]
MLYDQVTPRPNVWKANISAIKECAANTNWLVDTSISVEEAWSVFEGKFRLLTSPFIPYLVPRRPNNSPLWIIKQSGNS